MIQKAKNNEKVPVYGDGRNIRDWVHVQDHCEAIDVVLHKGQDGEIYNIGGGRHSNCSIIEAINYIEHKTGTKIKKNYINKNRVGDHIWYISDNKKFKKHYPKWKQKYNVFQIIDELIEYQ